MGQLCRIVLPKNTSGMWHVIILQLYTILPADVTNVHLKSRYESICNLLESLNHWRSIVSPSLVSNYLSIHLAVLSVTLLTLRSAFSHSIPCPSRTMHCLPANPRPYVFHLFTWIPVRVLLCPSLSRYHSLHCLIIVSGALSSPVVIPHLFPIISRHLPVYLSLILSCALCEFFSSVGFYLPVSLCFICPFTLLLFSLSSPCLYLYLSNLEFPSRVPSPSEVTFIFDLLFFQCYLYFLDFLGLTLFHVLAGFWFLDFPTFWISCAWPLFSTLIILLPP